MRQIAGHLDAKGLKFGIVLSRFNSRVTDLLLAGALDGLRRHGAGDEEITVIRVPGAFEIPTALRAVAAGDNAPDALLVLGSLIRGETPHFEYLATTVTRAMERIAAESSIPVANGLITADTFDQALDRAGGKVGNKGFDAAMSAIEMTNLLRLL